MYRLQSRILTILMKTPYSCNDIALHNVRALTPEDRKTDIQITMVSA